MDIWLLCGRQLLEGLRRQIQKTNLSLCHWQGKRLLYLEVDPTGSSGPRVQGNQAVAMEGQLGGCQGWSGLGLHAGRRLGGQGGGGARPIVARAARSQEVALGQGGARAEVTQVVHTWSGVVHAGRFGRAWVDLNLFPHVSRTSHSGPGLVAKMVKPKYKGRSTINPSKASTNPGTGGRADRGWSLEEVQGRAPRTGGGGLLGWHCLE